MPYNKYVPAWQNAPSTATPITAQALNHIEEGLETAAEVADAAVPATRTINGYPLSANVTVTKADVGLGSVDNTADSAKPVSTAQQAALNGKADKNRPQTVKSMKAYPMRSEPWKEVLFQDGADLYAFSQDTTGTTYKSTDHGTTWTTKGNAAMDVKAVIRLEATGTLLAIENTSTSTAGLNPKLKRSTDDGTTWTQVATLNFPVLEPQGFCETPSGYVLVGEYGNVANTAYRVMRSTDDGQTWTQVLAAPGTDVFTDPGHIHSVTFDRFTNTCVAFMDRPNPEIYKSTDEGATWTKVGTSTQSYHPNFVAPMYFDGYVAWGSDGNANGFIYRLSATDFYAGNWNSPILCAQVNRSAFYGSFEIRPGVWVISGATELLGADTTLPGSYAQDVYIVSNDGLDVAGGISHSDPNVNTNAVLGLKARFPLGPASTDQSGRMWINFNAAGLTRAYTAVPVTVGDSPVMMQTPSGGIITPIHLNNNQAMRAWSADRSAAYDILIYDTTNRVIIKNPISAGIPEVRLYETAGGRVSIMFNGATTFSCLPSTVDIAGSTIQMNGTTSPHIRQGTGSPEGVVTARVGSLFLRSDGGAGTCLYVKETGTGNTGWARATTTAP